MKHLLFAIGLVATLTSCSKKEGPAPTTPISPIVAKWAYVQRKNVSDSQNGSPVQVSVQNIPLGNSFEEFLANGTVRFYDKDGQPYSSDQTYTFVGSTLSFSHLDGSAGVTAIVKTLTSDSLVTVQNYTFINSTPPLHITQYFVRWK